MNKSYIIKAVIIAVVVWLVIALLQSLIRGIPFADGLVKPYNLFLAAIAGVGSYTGFRKKGK